MYANTTGSTNCDPVTSSTTPTLTDNTPLVRNPQENVATTVLRKMSGILRIPSRPTPSPDQSGYVEFGHLDNDNSLRLGPERFADPNSESHQKKSLGTFSGVFSPVALSMFSALLFIRVGFIVGNAGLWVTLLQFGIAYVILIFTVASVCAISTNGAVEGGGAYFMISRTLGPEFGGSIGTLFFLANIVSSALCISGCAEGLVENFGPSGYLISSHPLLNNSEWYRILYSSGLNGISLALCLIGATMFAKTSVLILAIVTLSLGSVLFSFYRMPMAEISIPAGNTLIQNDTYHATALYTGWNQTTLESNLWSAYGKDYTSPNANPINFAIVFGVLFSGVTGIMAGANMSGELKSPARSIPLGTLSAVGFTFISYISLAVLTAASCSRELLLNNYMYMMPINVWPPFVAIGVLTATFSAALSNLIGASRVLLALSKDEVFGSTFNFIHKGTFRGNPIVAVFCSWLLVQLMLFYGSLNLIAQINSVLFLLSYLATNIACVALQLTSAPNFRPSYKFFSVHTATCGLIGTICMMFVISPAYAGVSIAACIGLIAALHVFTSEREGKDAPYWGSISQALIFHQVRKYLLLLDSRKNHVKYWRPQILLLVSSPRSSSPLIDFINDIKKSGLYVLGHVFVPSEPKKMLDVRNDPSTKEYPLWLELVDFLKVKAFVELTTSSTVREGFQHLVRISGMGAMKPNTIVLGFYDNNKPIDFFNKQGAYNTPMFDSDGANFQAFPMRNRKQLDPVDYVCMVSDTLNMGKNICLARHFDSLDKSSISKGSNYKYIDIWTINVFKPLDAESLTAFDTNSLFMMQLATICTMVSVWKKLKLRVFVHIKTGEDMLRLEELLKLLRIQATIHEVHNWDETTGLLKTQSDDTPCLNYIRGCNRILRDKSSDCTAVSFIYLPSPPNFQTDNEFISFYNKFIEPGSNQFYDSDTSESSLCNSYLQLLTELTEGLPPSMLVHGLNAVTSTTL